MDNFDLFVIARGKTALTQCFSIAFETQGVKARGWYEDPDYGFVFLWSTPSSKKGAYPLPVPLSAEAAANMAWEWLAQAPYPKEPDLDGSVSKGFNAYTNQGALGDYSILAVKPIWAHHHK